MRPMMPIAGFPSSEWPSTLLPWIGLPSRVGRREQGFAGLARLRFAGVDVEADLLRIEVARAHAELLRALGGGLEHPVQRGHRAVVQIGRGGPDAVQRARAIVRFCFRRRVGTVAALTPQLRQRRLLHVAVLHPFPARPCPPRSSARSRTACRSRRKSADPCISTACRDPRPAAGRGSREPEPAATPERRPARDLFPCRPRLLDRIEHRRPWGRDPIASRTRSSCRGIARRRRDR